MRPSNRLLIRVFNCAMLGLLSVGAGHAGAVPVGLAGYSRVFYDPFDDTDFSDNWRHFRELGSTAGNGSGRYAAEAVTEKNGNLRIEAYSAEDANGVLRHYVGSVRSHRAFTYGYFEATIKFEGASGLHQAFWMMPQSAQISTQPPNAFLNGAELDIVEHRAFDADGVDISLATSHGDHYAGYGPNKVSNQRLIRNSLNDVDQFHRYGLLWDEDGYKFYIDDKYVGFTISDNEAGTAISGVEEFMILSNNVGVSWSGPVEETYGGLETKGSRMVIGSVSVYQQPVPEPGSLLALGGLSVCVLSRRERRSA